MRVCVLFVTVTALALAACSADVGSREAPLGDNIGEIPDPCPPTSTNGEFVINHDHPADAGAPCPDAGPPPPPPGRCWVTGGGQIFPTGQAAAAFGGNAKPFADGRTDGGEWNHLSFDGNHFHGDPDANTIECFLVAGPGAAPPRVEFNRIEFSGTGVWNHVSGYTFDVAIEDHGERGNNDTYAITIRDSGGTIVYSASGLLVHGNLQIHPTNPGHP